MKSLDAWNTIMRKLSGKSESLVAKRRLQVLPMEFVVTSDGMVLKLMGPFTGGKVILGPKEFDMIYPKYFSPSFSDDENEQRIIDCVCTVIDKYCIKHELKNNLNGSADL